MHTWYVLELKENNTVYISDAFEENGKTVQELEKTVFASIAFMLKIATRTNKIVPT